MSKQKVTLRIEEGEVELLKVKFNTDNLSEAIRLAIMQSLATKDLEKVKTLFPYIGKKPPRIGREVVNAFEQSGCEIFVDLFCGSIAMLCYLPWDVKVVVNDINGNLTNLYIVIQDRPSDFVSAVGMRWKCDTHTFCHLHLSTIALSSDPLILTHFF